MIFMKKPETMHTNMSLKGVLMLVNTFLPLPVDGAERQADHLAVYMAQQHLWVGVLTRKKGPHPKSEMRDGFEVIRIDQLGPGKVKSLTFTLGAIFAIFARRHEFSVLHAHLAFAPAVAATIAGRLLHKKVIIKFGGSGSIGDVETSKRTWRGRLALYIFRNWADICVALSDEMEKEMLEAGFLRSRVIRMVNGVDTKKFSPSVDKSIEKKALHFEGKQIILYTGRLVAVKNINVLLLAFQRSMAAVPNLHLFIIGDGEERSMLETLAADLGIQNNVTFVKWVEDIGPYLRSADIFVLPSQIEGISNSLLEAMSAGLPCIATRVGGSRETLGDGNNFGLLIEPDNVDQLVEAIVRLGSDHQEALRLGACARQRILDHYDLSIVGSGYYRLYEEITLETQR